MKFVFLSILILAMQSAIAQEKTDTGTNPTKMGRIIVTRSTGGTNAERITDKMQVCADSINYYTSGQLPYFLSDECFDFNSGLWDGFHAAICVRCKIIEKVNNKIALKKILRLHDKSLDRICDYKPTTVYVFHVPKLEQSFYMLLKERYQELQHKK